MKRIVLALLACGLLAACEDLPTEVTTNPGGAATNAAAPTNSSVAPTGGGQSTPAPSRYVPRTTPIQQAAPETQAAGKKSEAIINGNQVTVTFPDEEPVSYVNGVPVTR